MDKDVLEDYRVGEVFVSPGRTITETDVVNFAGITGDWHPLHTDVTYAATTQFGERIVHGMLVLVVGSALIFRVGQYVVIPKTFIAFYGMDQVRYTAPVKIGDTIHLEYEIVELIEKDAKRGIISGRGTIKNQRGEPCCIYNMKLLCGRRQAEKAA